MYSVIYLGIHVVGPAREHDSGHSVFIDVIKCFLAFFSDIVSESVVLFKSGFRGGRNLFRRKSPLFKFPDKMSDKFFSVYQRKERVYKLYTVFADLLYVVFDNLGI